MSAQYESRLESLRLTFALNRKDVQGWYDIGVLSGVLAKDNSELSLVSQAQDVLALGCVESLTAGVCEVDYLCVKDSWNGSGRFVCGDGNGFGWWCL